MTYRRYCFCDPAVPLVPYLGCAVFRASDWCRLRLSWRPHPLVELDLSSRVSPSHTYPTAAAVRSSHGLLLPTAHPGSEVHCSRAQSLPATFRLQGLVTLLTVYSLESLAGFVSHRQRSWDSPFGGFPSREALPAFRPEGARIPLCPAVFLPPEGARPARRTSVSGLIPPESALRSRGVLVRRPPAPPMGFAPLGSATKALNPDFSGPPLTRFAGPGDCSPNSPALQSLDRPSLRPTRHTPKCTPAEATLVGFLHLPDPEHSSEPVSGLWSSPCVASCITADRPTRLRHQQHPAEAVQDPSWVPSIATFTSHTKCNLKTAKCKQNQPFSLHAHASASASGRRARR